MNATYEARVIGKSAVGNKRQTVVCPREEEGAELQAVSLAVGRLKRIDDVKSVPTGTETLAIVEGVPKVRNKTSVACGPDRGELITREAERHAAHKEQQIVVTRRDLLPKGHGIFSDLPVD